MISVPSLGRVEAPSALPGLPLPPLSTGLGVCPSRRGRKAPEAAGRPEAAPRQQPLPVFQVREDD